MDVTRYVERLLPAPCAVFEGLEERADRPRFFVRGEGGAWEPVTWRQFAQEIAAVARFLVEQGVRPGDRVAVFAPNSVRWGAAALGIQAAGAALVPIYPSSTPEQAAYVLEHSGARLVFADSEEIVRRLPERIPSVYLGDPAPAGTTPWDEVLAHRDAGMDAAREMLAELSLDQVAVLLYTSGTTGPPKGVPLTHRNTAVNARDWLQNNASLLSGDEDVDVLWLPMSHVFGLGELCLGNTLGFTTYLAGPAEALEAVREVAPTVFMAVPAYWKKLAAGALAEGDPAARRRRLLDATGGRLRFCLSGGAGLDLEVKELFDSAGMLIIEGYGLTECSPTLTLNRPDAYRFDSVGKPLPSVELRLAEDGEILARGPNVFSGYFQDPESTRAAFTGDGWFKTGDLGRFTEDGFLQIVGRKKEILVTAGGKNIPPGNIEMRFDEDPAIAHAVVYGDGKKYLVAGIWLEPSQLPEHLREGATEEALEAFAAERVARVNAQLARHETIKRFRVMHRPLTVEEGFLTPSLKLKRKKVYEAFRGEFEALYREEAA